VYQPDRLGGLQNGVVCARIDAMATIFELQGSRPDALRVASGSAYLLL
jgi:hypothetical protein